MKTPLNDNQSSSDWLEQAIQTHLAAKTNRADSGAPSPEFRARCRAAALGALDVLKMQHKRPRVASTPGSLWEHFETLARLAGVKLDAAFQTLGVTRANALDVDNARGLAMLARQLGLARDEVMLRLRWEFARLEGAVLPMEWPGTMQPARARRSTGAGSSTSRGKLNEALRRHEADYAPSRRTELRAALNVVAEIYEQDAV